MVHLTGSARYCEVRGVRQGSGQEEPRPDADAVQECLHRVCLDGHQPGRDGQGLFPLWRYNPEAAEKKITIDSQDKSDTVSFAKNAVSKELGENRFKQLIKKVGEEKAMAMLQKSEEGFKENYQLIKKLAEIS